MIKNIVVIGGSGAIGAEFVNQFSKQYQKATVHVFSRSYTQEGGYKNIMQHPIDYSCEQSIALAANQCSQQNAVDMIVVATGILHDSKVNPEKTLKQISAEKLLHIFKVNTIVPALVAKHFIPKMNQVNRTIFAVLSARIGSISDNHLGGWYGYRMSKSALNMLIKTLSVEIKRSNKNAIIVGLHPGTVDSHLSKPFQGNISQSQLFSAEYSVSRLIQVLDNLNVSNTGRCYAWDGSEILP